MRIFVCAFVLSLFGTASSLDATHGLLRERYESQRKKLHERLQRLQPQQRRDIGTVIPQLKAGDKTGFKESLATMLHAGADGGKTRIKRCLDGLSVAGFNALEIQTWLESSTAPVPQSAFLNDPANKQAGSKALRTTKTPVEEKKETPAPQKLVSPHVSSVGAMSVFAAEQEKKQLQEETDWDAIKELEQKGPELAQAAEPLNQDDEVKKQAEATAQLAAEKMEKWVSEKSVAEKAGKQKKKDHDKAALRRELAKRLEKGVQALKRVGSVEKQETALKSSMSSEEARIKRLEDSLNQETQATKHVEDENAKLKAEVAEEDKRSLSVEARLDALEKREQQTSKRQTEEKLHALEEAYGKFRTGLAGAAKRIINLEAKVAAGPGKKAAVLSQSRSQPAMVPPGVNKVQPEVDKVYSADQPQTKTSGMLQEATALVRSARIIRHKKKPHQPAA